LKRNSVGIGLIKISFKKLKWQIKLAGKLKRFNYDLYTIKILYVKILKASIFKPAGKIWKWWIQYPRNVWYKTLLKN